MQKKRQEHTGAGRTFRFAAANASRYFFPAFFAAFLLIRAASPARAEGLGGCFGYVRGMAGEVSYQERNGQPWKNSSKDMCLYDNFGIRTGENSGALVVLDDLSEIRLGENTLLYFTSVSYKYLLTRLTGVSLLSGELFMDITEGYNDIMVQSETAGVSVSGAGVDIMLLREDENDPESGLGTAVFVTTGAVDVFDVFLKYRVTVGEGQQTNVSRRKPPQDVYFYNEKTFKAYIKIWRNNLQPGKVLDKLYDKDAYPRLRDATLACPSDFYKSALWCCPNSCSKGLSSLPQDIYCPDGTYYVGNRVCCDNECRR